MQTPKKSLHTTPKDITPTIDLKMSGINHILQTFEGLGDGDRETTMKALSTMMRVDTERQSPKKKVNGFMGYRGELT